MGSACSVLATYAVGLTDARMRAFQKNPTTIQIFAILLASPAYSRRHENEIFGTVPDAGAAPDAP